MDGSADGENRFIIGSRIPNYNQYCPITQVYAYRQPDGSYRAHYLKPLTLQESDFLESPGFLIVYLGTAEKDYTTETAATALYNSLKSLFAACDIPVDYERIRTTVELSEYMKTYRHNYSHLILIGHGTTDGISFLDKRKPIAGAELGGCLGSDTSEKPLQIISLCCHSGCANLAKALSNSPYITEVLAPNKVFDMRWAVHFVTGFFLYMYISQFSIDEAVNHAARTSGNAPMCIWRKGKLIGECAKVEHLNLQTESNCQ